MVRKLPLAATGLLALLLCIPGAAARFGMPDPSTSRGRIIESLYAQIFIAAVIVFVIVVAWLAIVLIRYREGSGHGQATYEAERDNLKAEFGWTVIPLLIVLWVGWISYGGLLALDEEAETLEADLTLDIIGSQWNWEARYGDGVSIQSQPDARGRVAEDNVFMVPAGKVIRFNITASDVIHSFFICELPNCGPVGMVDANPTGPGKFTSATAVFEEGEYLVQCREMCLNPGHAIMRARIEAVPQQDYDSWLLEKRLEAACEFRVQKITIDVGADLLIDGADMLDTTKDTCVVARVNNTLAQPVQLDVEGTSASLSIGGGAGTFWSFDITQEGTFQMTASNGGNATITAIEAEAIEIELDEWVIIPPQVELKAGTTYLVSVRNLGTTVHNVYFGDYGGADSEVLASSATVNPGETTAFVWTPEADTTVQLETWCNIAGHYENGMRASATVTA